MKHTNKETVFYSLYRLGAYVFPFDNCIATDHFLHEMRDSNFSWKEVAITYENGIWVCDGVRWHVATMDTKLVLEQAGDDTFTLITVYPIHEQLWFRLLDLAAMDWRAVDSTPIA